MQEAMMGKVTSAVFRKPCRKCGVLDRFPSGACRPCVKAQQSGRDGKSDAAGYYRRNRAQVLARMHVRHEQRRESQPDVVHATELYKGFRMSLTEWQRMFDAQGGVCAVCKKPETVIDRRTGKSKRLAVDHCHQTNLVRGLLCARCNRLLGSLDGSLGVLEAALQYQQSPPFSSFAIPCEAKLFTPS